MRNEKLVIFAIVFLLILAFAAPVLITGYGEIEKGETAFQAGEYGEAADAFARAARLLPWRNDLWERAGISLSKMEEFSQAINYLSQVNDLSEEGRLALGYSYFFSNDVDRSLRIFEECTKRFRSAACHAGRAFVFRSQKNWRAEQAELEGQIQLDPSNAFIHYRLGLLLTILEPTEALDELERASSLDPQFDPAIQTLRAALTEADKQADLTGQNVTIGRALGLVNEWELSISNFGKAVELDPQNAEAWAWLGEAKGQTGQDGREELDKAVSIDGTSVIVHALRGLYWNRQEKYDEMVAEYLLTVEYDPENPVWHASLGDAYIKSGDLALALSEYQRATELAPTDSTYWRLLAVFCAENGVRLDDIGLPAAKKAVELSPEDPLALDAMGFNYLSSGRFANAELIFTRIIEDTPDYYPAHIHLAMNYLAQGNHAAAYDELTYVRDTDKGGRNGEIADQMLGKYFP